MAHLPDDLALPLATGRGHWHWLGGRPSVDLLNTRRERWRRDIETLVSPQDLAAWLDEADLLGPDHRPTRTDLRSALALRDAIDDAFIAVAGGRPAPAAAIAHINRHLACATTPRQLSLADGAELVLSPTTPPNAVQHALGRLALDAATILTESRNRLRVCAADHCSTRFHDASPAAGRQWCSMASCGNAAKARRHRARYR